MLPCAEAALDLDRAAVRLGDRERARAGRGRRRSAPCRDRAGRRRTARTGTPGPPSGMPGPSSVTDQRTRPSRRSGPAGARSRPSSGANRWALATRLSRARSRRGRSPKTRWARPSGKSSVTVWPRCSASGRIVAAADSASSRGVERAELESDRARPVAGEVEDLADQVLHPLGVALHRLEHRPALLVGRVRRRIEQQAGERPHHGDRRPQLVGDDRQEVRPHPLQVLHRHRGVGPGAARDDPLCPRLVEDVFGGGAARERPGPGRATGARPGALGDARPQVGAGVGEPSLEVGGRRAALDECERRERPAVSSRPGRTPWSEHTTRRVGQTSDLDADSGDARCGVLVDGGRGPGRSS